jgi:hypothetical protein
VDKRTNLLGVRVNAEERRVVDMIAQHEERTPSDVIRRLLRREAQRLGIISVVNEERRPEQSAGVRV